MANTPNYVTQFMAQIIQKYKTEAQTDALTTQKVSFVGTRSIKIPHVTTGGYKPHSRNGGFNRQAVSNGYYTKELEFDRDVEFFVDSMDVDETNQALSAANITGTFLTDHAIPEMDAYRMSKIYADHIDFGGVADTSTLDESNILAWFDEAMAKMTEKSVPVSGRIFYATPGIRKILKGASGLTRQLNVGIGASGIINRKIASLDDVTIKDIQSDRFMSVYDFSDGFTPGVGAKQMNAMLIHPSCVVAAEKHSYIRLWAEGTHTQGDGWLYQNRKYGDLFVYENRNDAISINMNA